MKTMQERINKILSDMEGPDRGKQTRLAEIAGCTRGLVSQWIAGSNESMGYQYAKNIEAKLGFSADWVMQGTPPMRTKPEQSDVETTSGAMVYSFPENRKTESIVQIPQYDSGGSMGTGVLLRDQPGVIQGWVVSPDWVQKNVRSYSRVENLAIVTGFGDSMRGMFNPGDPLLVDRGVTTVDVDAVYFFRVGNEGFIKRLQRIPGEGIRVKSVNPEYDTWTIKPDMDFEVFARVIKVWCGTDF